MAIRSTWNSAQPTWAWTIRAKTTKKQISDVSEAWNVAKASSSLLSKMGKQTPVAGLGLGGGLKTPVLSHDQTSEVH